MLNEGHIIVGLLFLHFLASSGISISSSGVTHVGSFSFDNATSLEIPCSPGAISTSASFPTKLFFCNDNQHWDIIFKSSPAELFSEYAVNSQIALSWNSLFFSDFSSSCDEIASRAKIFGKTTEDGFYWLADGSSLNAVYCRFLHNHDEVSTSFPWTLLARAVSASDFFRAKAGNWSSSSTHIPNDLNTVLADYKSEAFSSMGLSKLMFEFHFPEEEVGPIGAGSAVHSVGFSLSADAAGETATSLFSTSFETPGWGRDLSSSVLFGATTPLVNDTLQFLSVGATDGVGNVEYNDVCRVALGTQHFPCGGTTPAVGKIALCLGRQRGYNTNFVAYPSRVVYGTRGTVGYFNNSESLLLPGYVLIFGA